MLGMFEIWIMNLVIGKVELLPKPSKRLPLHAGIFLSIDGRLQTADDISPDIDFFQKELAMLCDGVHKF